MGPWRIVSTVTAWHVAASVCYYAVYAGTPFFREAFGLSRFAVGIALGAMSLGYAVALLPIGGAVDAYGERPTLAAGLVGLSACALAVAVAPSYAALLAALLALGAAYGTATPGTNKAIFDRVPAGRQNLAIGVKQLGPVAGSALGAVLVTNVAAAGLGWQGGFLAAGGTGLVVAGGFLLAYPSGRDPGSGRGLPDLRGLLGNPPLRRTLLAGFPLGAIVYTTSGYTLLYVNEGVGVAVGFAGVVFAVVQVAGGAGRVASGWLGDRLPGAPARRTTGILLAQAVAGAALLASVPLLSSPLGALVGFALVGLFVLGLAGMYFSVVGAVAPSDDTGGASAAAQLALVLGGLGSVPAFGYLVDAAGYPTAWLFLAGIAGLGALLTGWAMLVTPG